MISLHPVTGDSRGFLEQVQCLIAGAIAVHAPSEAYIVALDNWFGPSWLRFAGRGHGRAKVHRRVNVTVPPFHPNRVRVQLHVSEADDGYARTEAPALQVRQASARNLERRLDRVSRDGLFAWYSGNTEENGRGALMVYLNTPRVQSYFYVSLVRERDGTWKREFIRDLTLKEVLAFERAGAAA